MVEPLSNGDSNGRNGDGKFAKGNPGGPGNPNAESAWERHREITGLVSMRVARKCIKTLVAIVGDENSRPCDKVNAAKVLLSYRYGTPAPMPDLLTEQRLTNLEQQHSREA